MEEKLESKQLFDIINYQEGSVVSRSLIKRETGNVTIFAFDEDQGLSEHTAPFDAMVYIIDGKVDITISGNTTTLQHGEMIIMPAKEPHSLKAIDKFKMMLIMIKS